MIPPAVSDPPADARSQPRADEASRPLRPVRVAVVGVGRRGLAHAAVLSMVPDCTLAGLVDPRRPATRSARGQGFKAPAFPSFEKLLEAEKPDAVFVCTPSDRHLPVAKAALEAGAAVFVEKPLAHTLADAEALATLATSTGRPVVCGYVLPYLPVFARVREVLVFEALGKLQQARASMYQSLVFGARQGWRFDPARSGGGVVANVSSDLLHFILWTLGIPVDVSATWSQHYGDAEDELRATMRLAGGAEIGFDSSWSTPGYTQPAAVVEIEGENGRLLVSDDALELDLLGARGGFREGHSRWRAAELPQRARFDLDGEGLYLEDSAFLAWVTGGPQPPSHLGAALSTQRVMDALYQSARAGGTTVPVNA